MLRAKRGQSSAGTSICPTDQDRARVLDNSGHVGRSRTLASVAVGLALLVAIPRYGWWIGALFALSMINNQTLDARMRRSTRPEYHVLCSIVLIQLITGVAAGGTGGIHSGMLPLTIVPTAFAAARFRPRVAFVLTLFGLASVTVAVLLANASAVVSDPVPLIIVLAVIFGVFEASQALTAAELEQRDIAVLDPLTGVLNRQGLEPRFAELAQQAQLTGAPISVLACDLDHFKTINDTHGHAIGDAVLRDVAYAMRKQLRAFELVYRTGGDEFVILLPGADASTARRIAERVRLAVSELQPQTIPISLSIGISTRLGSEAEYTGQFAAGDRALYAAKARGRNQAVTEIDAGHDRATIHGGVPIAAPATA